jgi:hypothetical protein
LLDASTQAEGVEMGEAPQFGLVSTGLGALPLVNHIADRLGLSSLLRKHSALGLRERMIYDRW